MKFCPPSGHCQNCFYHMEQGILEYSLENYSFALCTTCQQALKKKLAVIPEETRDLYFSLKKRNVPAMLEKINDDKTMDISIMHASVNIEVDTSQQNINPQQAFSNLQRSHYSFKQGFLTLRIPNTLIREKLDETADYISDFLVFSKQKNTNH